MPDSEPKLNGFVARLSGDLKTIKQRTYFGGSDDDEINAMLVVPVGPDDFEVVIAGKTASLTLPCTLAVTLPCENAAQSIKDASADGFVARLSADLTELRQATFYGGNGIDNIKALAMIETGSGSFDILVGGETGSNNLPCVALSDTCSNGAQMVLGSGTDGFVARFSADLIELRQSTYFGGEAPDFVTVLAVVPGQAGETLIVAGGTRSPVPFHAYPQL